MAKKGLKIIKLQAENVKKLKAVEISPEGNMVKLSGKNAQGKSSVLDAIWLALGGGDAEKATKTDRPIRDGAETAEITLDLGDYIVTRKWTANDKSYLSVKTQDGAKYSSPQKLLDGLIGKLSFDPLAFAGMDGKKQLETLLDLVDLEIDLDEMAKQRSEIFNQRTLVNREVDQLKAQIKPIDPTIPEEEVSAADVISEMQDAQKALEKINDKKVILHQLAGDTNDTKRNIDYIKKEIEHHEEMLANKRKRLEELEGDFSELMTKGKALKAEIEAAVTPDLEPFKERLANVEKVNADVRFNREMRDLQDLFNTRAKEAQDLTSKIKHLDDQKAAALKAAKFPIKGLGFDDAGVTFNGLPFNQCSKGEQIKISFAMAMALNPDLKVIRITDGSLLDEDNLKMIEEMAKSKDYQVWIEIVDSSGQVGIYIEDGEIKNG